MFEVFDSEGKGSVDYKHFVVALSVFASKDILDDNLGSCPTTTTMFANKNAD